RMQGRGVSGDAHISWPELMQFKRTFTDPVPADREKAFQKAGIATYYGPARFVSPERLSVDGQVLEARHFVVAAGAKPRHPGVPHPEGPAIRAATIAARPERGSRVNKLLQTVTKPRVYASGDASAAPGSLPLTPVAAYEGAIVASNLLKGNARRPDYRGIPSVVFTVPPLAGVGLTEAQAQAQQLDVRVKSEDTSTWYTNRRVAETCAMFKVVVDDKADRVVGAHLLGPHADEVINLFALAIRSGVPATDLKHLLYA